MAANHEAGSEPARSEPTRSTTTPTRNASQIEADVTATRHRLSASVESLIDEVHPNRIKQRWIDKAKAFAHTQVETAKSLVFNARGDLRTDRVIAVGAAAAGAITFLVIVRSLANRRRAG